MKLKIFFIALKYFFGLNNHTIVVGFPILKNKNIYGNNFFLGDAGSLRIEAAAWAG